MNEQVEITPYNRGYLDALAQRDAEVELREARETQLRDALSALRVICGPADGHDPWMDAYREAGGGYSGLQAIAGAALERIESLKPRAREGSLNDPR